MHLQIRSTRTSRQWCEGGGRISFSLHDDERAEAIGWRAWYVQSMKSLEHCLSDASMIAQVIGRDTDKCVAHDRMDARRPKRAGVLGQMPAHLSARQLFVIDRYCYLHAAQILRNVHLVSQTSRGSLGMTILNGTTPKSRYRQVLSPDLVGAEELGQTLVHAIHTNGCMSAHSTKVNQRTHVSTSTSFVTYAGIKL